MNQEPTFSYATTHPNLAFYSASVISGVMNTLFAFRTFLNYQEGAHEIARGSYLAAIGTAAMIPLLAATFQKWKGQDENEKLPFDASKGWFSLIIAASTTAIANSIYYSSTQTIHNNVAIGISGLSGMVIATCAMRMYMDRIRENNTPSLT
jgi:hypothetical protein